MANSLKIPQGNLNPYIKEQTTQWPKEKVQTTIYKAYTSKDRVTGTPLKSHNKCTINGD
jgi:hypothetical protein